MVTRLKISVTTNASTNEKTGMNAATKTGTNAGVKARLATMAVVLLLALGAYVLYNAIEVYDKNIKQGWDRKAQANPYLAAEQYLTLRGNKVESSKRLKRLDQLPEGGAVFISDSRQLQTQVRVTELVNWMAQGGRLVVGASMTKNDNKNLLLDYFGVTKAQADCACDDNDKKSNEFKKISELLREAGKELSNDQSGKTGKQAEPDNDAIPTSELTELFFQNVQQSFRIQFSDDTALYHPALDKGTDNDPATDYQGPTPFYWEGNQAGAQFMQFQVGDGLLTVLGEGSIWASDAIGKGDHAFLLSVLMRADNDIVLLYGMQMPSIMEMLRQYAPELLIASMIWLLVWLMYKARRFGPIREQDIVSRRSLDEHIVASSALLWRAKKGNTMIENSQRAIFRKLKCANPGFDALDNNAQISWISKRCGLSTDQVVQALYVTDIRNEDHFYQIVSLIQKIGNKL